MIRYELRYGDARCTVALDVDNPFTAGVPVFEGDAGAVLAVKRALMRGVGLAIADLRSVDGDGLRAWMESPALAALTPVMVEGDRLWRPGGWSIARHDCVTATRRLGETLGALAAIPRSDDPSADSFAWLTLRETVAYGMGELPVWNRHCRGAHDASLDQAAQDELRRLGAPRSYTGDELLRAFEQACAAGEERSVLTTYWRILDGAPS